MVSFLKSIGKGSTIRTESAGEPDRGGGQKLLPDYSIARMGGWELGTGALELRTWNPEPKTHNSQLETQNWGLVALGGAWRRLDRWMRVRRSGRTRRGWRLAARRPPGQRLAGWRLGRLPLVLQQGVEEEDADGARDQRERAPAARLAPRLGDVCADDVELPAEEGDKRAEGEEECGPHGGRVSQVAQGRVGFGAAWDLLRTVQFLVRRCEKREPSGLPVNLSQQVHELVYGEAGLSDKRSQGPRP